MKEYTSLTRFIARVNARTSALPKGANSARPTRHLSIGIGRIYTAIGQMGNRNLRALFRHGLQRPAVSNESFRHISPRRLVVPPLHLLQHPTRTTLLKHLFHVF